MSPAERCCDERPFLREGDYLWIEHPIRVRVRARVREEQDCLWMEHLGSPSGAQLAIGVPAPPEELPRGVESKAVPVSDPQAGGARLSRALSPTPGVAGQQTQQRHRGSHAIGVPCTELPMLAVAPGVDLGHRVRRSRAGVWSGGGRTWPRLVAQRQWRDPEAITVTGFSPNQ